MPAPVPKLIDVTLRLEAEDIVTLAAMASDYALELRAEAGARGLSFMDRARLGIRAGTWQSISRRLTRHIA